ncbi:MAG: UDP-N-acetylmuramate--L-alanine ligase [Chloroflexota bacterium]
MHYHIIGIAGAGMSAIANIFLDQDHTISGSDMQHNAYVDALAARGATISAGHDTTHGADADAVLVTSAAKPDHPELQAAHNRGIPVLKRTDIWREWSQQRKVVAVAGTHGKTTTTALIAHILMHAQRDPGFLVGAHVPSLGTNARWGSPEAPLIIEADEYDRAFLSLMPALAIITNIELDHVDIYPTAEVYDDAFVAFANTVQEARRLIVCADDAGVQRVLGATEATYYGIDERIAGNPVDCRRQLLNWSASGVQSSAQGTTFDLWHYNQRTLSTRRLGPRTMPLHGDHNVRNALAAIAATSLLGVNQETIAEALTTYRGAERRFELKGEVGGITIIDDYAHHPTEVLATLQAARRSYAERRIVAYLQPHTFSRTQALLDAWGDVFKDADVVRIGDIYAAREQNTSGVDSTQLVTRIRHPDVAVVGAVQEATTILENLLRPGDVLFTLGAGDGYQIGEELLRRIGAKHKLPATDSL